MWPTIDKLFLDDNTLPGSQRRQHPRQHYDTNGFLHIGFLSPWPWLPLPHKHIIVARLINM